MYIYTGGEPLVRKKDLIKICEMHPDCEFLSFTNGTLIDEEFCQEMLRVKNFVPAISLEGFERFTALFWAMSRMLRPTNLTQTATTLINRNTGFRRHGASNVSTPQMRKKS